MEALKRKWKSSCGASILLALLFLLLCVMVGASVIMAAASNGGKIRSNQEEQQRYLALSSALRLVCDELESMEYVGRYKYGYVEVYSEEVVGKDNDGNDIYGWVYKHNRHYYWQQEGLLRARDGVAEGVGAEKKWRLMDTIPFQHDLDAIFGENFVAEAIENRRSDDEYEDSYCTALNDVELTLNRSPFEQLTLTPVITGGGDILNTKILLTASMNPNNGQITLTATFDDDNSYIMTAYLFCSESGDNSGISSNPKRNLLLSGAPANQECIGVDGATKSLDKTKAKDNETEKKLVWTLSRMVKGKKEVTGP